MTETQVVKYSIEKALAEEKAKFEAEKKAEQDRFVTFFGDKDWEELERVAKEQAKEEERIANEKAEAEEKARKERLRPDKERLVSFAEEVKNFTESKTVPSGIKDEEAENILLNCLEAIQNAGIELKKEALAL
jgi:hypothetical protein